MKTVVDQSAASLRSLSDSLPLPKMCQNSSRFPSPSSWRRRNFLGKHFRIPGICGGAAAKARLLCSLFLYAALGTTAFLTGGQEARSGRSASQLLLMRHRVLPRTAGHRPLDFFLREERSVPPFQDLILGERTGADVGGYWRSLPANSSSFLIQQIRRGNAVLTRASVKIGTLGTMSLSPHFSLVLLLHLFPHLSHSGISWTGCASSSI